MAGKTARGLGKGLDSLIPDAVGEAKAKKESEESKASGDAGSQEFCQIGRASCRERV